METTPPASSSVDTPDHGSDRGWASVAHLVAFVGLAVPLGNILGPLVVWLLKRHDSALVDDQGREAVNFQISVTIYLFALGILIFTAAVLEAPVVAMVGVPLLLAIALGMLILMIVAAVRANNGVRFRYPLTIRWIGSGTP